MESNLDKGIQKDEPLTPTGRLFLQPEMDTVINCAIAGKHPIDVDAVKAEVNNSLLLQHPRFYSLYVKDSRGREYWRQTQVNIDRHIIVRHEPLTDDPNISDEDAVNGYLADLSVSCPLSTDKPLWEIHLIMAHRCAVFRVHHALGDGISLMSMFLSLCRLADDPTQPPTINGVGASNGSSAMFRMRWSLCSILKMLLYTLVSVLELVMRSLWLKDKKTAVVGGAGVELWPRKLSTAKFLLDDMKIVKKAIVNATINDVLFGMVSYGLSKYLHLRSPKDLQEGQQITGVAMVNLRRQPGLQELKKLLQSKSGTRWGNKFGMILLPVYYHKGGDDPLQFVKRAKKMIDKKKQSLEAICSYLIEDIVMSCFGAKLASSINYRILCNTTFTISNVMGPREEITIIGNPVTFIRVNLTSLSQAITMHMVSYAGRADMQISVAKDIIPDPDVLAKCFEDALHEMKAAAEAAIKPGEGRSADMMNWHID